MSITRQQALTAQRFHENATCTARSAATWRRNGATQTWATRPSHFRIPVKYGLRDYAQIYHTDADLFHAEEDCLHGHRW